MNYSQVIKAIEKTAAMQPPVGTIVRQDIFRLNAFPQVRYGVVAWLPGEHTTSAQSDLMRWAFTLFFADRLTGNGDNEVVVQSTGIEVLSNILRVLEGLGIYAGDYSFTTFNQRFADLCAGVFCRVTLEAPRDTMCAQAWDYLENVASFNLDYNTDFHCWEWRNGERNILII